MESIVWFLWDEYKPRVSILAAAGRSLTCDQVVQNAIEKGVAKAAADSPGDKTAAMCSAMTNVAVMLKDNIAGRIALEVDPRLADDAGVTILPTYSSRDTIIVLLPQWRCSHLALGTITGIQQCENTTYICCFMGG